MSHTSDMTFLVRAVFTVWTFIWFIQHVWNIDRFKALKWRRIKKFELKSAITILLLLMCPLQAFYDISISVIKYREGYILNPLNGEIVSKPHSFWSETNKALLLPTDYILCASLSVQTCLLFLLQSFWNYLANSLAKTTFMGSFEFKSYIIYSIFSILIFPILQYIFRENDLLTEVVPQLVYSIFMILICILGVRSHWRFTELLKVTKNSSVAQINIVSKLAYFRDMNRYLTFALFIGSISLAALSIDGLTSKKWLNSHKFSSDLLICHLNFSIWIVFVTLFLIFYPSSSTFNDPIQSTTKSSTSASSASFSSNKTFTKNERSLNPSKWIPKSYTTPEEDYVKLKNSSSPWSSQQSHSANDGFNNSYYIDINDDSTVVNINSNNGNGGGGSHNNSNSNYYINNKTDINISSKQLKKCMKQIRSGSLDVISPPPITPPSPYRPHVANEPLTAFKSSPSSSPSPPSPSSPLLPPPVAIPTTANTAQFNFYNSKSTIKTNKSIEVLKYPSSPLTKSTFDINNNNERSFSNSGGIQSPQKVSTMRLLSPPPFYNNNIRNSSSNDHDDSDDDDSLYFLQKFSNPTTNIILSSPPIAPKKSSKRPSITTIKTKTNDNNYTSEINVKGDVVDNNNNKKSSNIVASTRKLTIKFQDDLKSKPHHNLTVNTTNVNNVNKSNINNGSDNGNGFNRNTTTPLSNIGATKTASKNQKTKVSSKLITTTITKTLSRPSSIEGYYEAQSKSSSSKSSSSKSSSSSPSPSPSSPSPTIKSSSKSSSPSSSPSPTIKSPSSKSKKPPPSSKSQQKIGNTSKPYQQSPLNPKRSDKPESLKTSRPPITVRARSGSSSNVIESNSIRKSVINRSRSNSTNTLNNSNSVLIGGGTRNIFGSSSSTKGNASSRGGGGGGVRGINIMGRSRSDSNSSASSSGSSSNESSSSSSSSSSFGDSGNNNGKFRKGILKKKVIKPTRDTVLGVI